jgi:crotonobetainyl-CoA:carnitine CoA-transferase CaiB-like acyl-CoA transferase
VGALEPQFWVALCGALGREDLLGDAFASGDRRNEVIAELEQVFMTRSRAEWMAEFDGLDVCVGPVNGFGEAFEDEHVRARRMVFEDDVPGAGKWTHIGDPLKFESSNRADSMRLPPPGMGEHTAEVLGSLGKTDEEVEAFRAAGVV